MAINGVIASVRAACESAGLIASLAGGLTLGRGGRNARLPYAAIRTTGNAPDPDSGSTGGRGPHVAEVEIAFFAATDDAAEAIADEWAGTLDNVAELPGDTITVHSCTLVGREGPVDARDEGLDAPTFFYVTTYQILYDKL
jgi:hypothetical protein